MKPRPGSVEMVKNRGSTEAMVPRKYHGKRTQIPQTASCDRPRLRRLRMTRRPVWLRMRTRNPLTRLRLRLVPSSVRLVIVALVSCAQWGRSVPTDRQFCVVR